MAWYESPQYMKGIQKIKSMSPEDKAITQTLVDELHGLYAGADMRKQLSAMHTASRGKQMDRRLELGERRLAMGEDVLDFEKGQRSTARGLGLGNIALSGLTGYADMRNRKKLGRSLDRIAGMYPKRS